MTMILFAALLFAQPPEDDALCDALKQIVAAAPGGYHAIAGEPDDSIHDGLRGTVIPEIGGWDFCSVTSGSTGPDYMCLANRQGIAPTDTEVATLANRVADCFGAQAREIEGIPGPRAYGYPQRRQIALPDMAINLTAIRLEKAPEQGWQRMPRYLAAKPAHDYALYLEFRAVDHGTSHQ